MSASPSLVSRNYQILGIQANTLEIPIYSVPYNNPTPSLLYILSCQEIQILGMIVLTLEIILDYLQLPVSTDEYRILGGSYIPLGVQACTLTFLESF